MSTRASLWVFSSVSALFLLSGVASAQGDASRAAPAAIPSASTGDAENSAARSEAVTSSGAATATSESAESVAVTTEQAKPVGEAPAAAVETVEPPPVEIPQRSFNDTGSPAAATVAEELVPPVTPTVDNDAVFRAFSDYAQNARLMRFIGGASGIVGGGTLIGVGIVAKDAQDDLADLWLVMGGVTVGLSALTLVFPSAPESIARAHGVGVTEGATAEQALALERAWEEHAVNAKKQRVRAGIVSLILSGVSIGFGVAVAGGEFTFSSSNERAVVGAILVGMGATAAVASLGSFVLPSQAERSLAIYKATKGAGSLSSGGGGFQLALGGAPAGLGLGLNGGF